MAIASGASIKSVQRMLGHKSAVFTLDLYGHLYEDELDQVAERLNKLVRPECAPTQPSYRLLSVTACVDLPTMWGRLRDSNPRPTHYECVALAS